MTLKMLIVEDNELPGKAVAALFETLGFTTTVIADGLKVIPYLEKNQTDIMILDLELPGMTGDKIYKAIREDKKLKTLPIVSFTAHRDTGVANSLPGNLILAEYTKTGKIPGIVYKDEDPSDSQKVNHRLVDEVAFALITAGIAVTDKMAKWYMQTRGLKPSDIMKQ